MPPGTILLESLSKSYGGSGSRISVLKNLNLSIPPASFVTLMGPSGSGKSSLLHILAGIDRCDSGKVEIFGKNLHEMDEKSLTLFRRENIGIIFQFFNLLTYLNALENVSIPLYLAGIGKKKAHSISESALESVGLKDRMYHKPTELSGGEQQRVAIARAIANNPGLILADEPTGNLDSANAKMVMDLLRKLQSEKKLTLFVVTHDRDIGGSGEIQIRMKDGCIENWQD
ncbi:MAG: ABC transporter ATP-binding protein [Leptospiraceae bacterium]|nr:ABC transporter ATP-binding protein [Leptospiraceae bacterium]MCP5511821.1 ABC transporter ATP-binding protein [Leptospiraceae bacterium]